MQAGLPAHQSHPLTTEVVFLTSSLPLVLCAARPACGGCQLRTLLSEHEDIAQTLLPPLPLLSESHTSMRYVPLALLLTCLFSGCADPSAESKPTDEATSSEVDGSPDSTSTAEDQSTAPGNKISLSPANTSIKFVGNHTGDDPKPRSCSFAEFDGTVVVDDTLKSIEVTIKTTSIQTEFDNLTTHLKNADFFDVNQFPEAKFVSTNVLSNGEGLATISGELTLLGQTHPVSFEAKVDAAANFNLSADFEIDRTVWGMNYDPSKVEKMVELSINIGQQ